MVERLTANGGSWPNSVGDRPVLAIASHEPLHHLSV
jgi:hypothetical protein